MIITLSIIAIVALWLFFSGILSRKDGTTLAALSFGSYVIIYIISSAIFVAMDKFTINNACMLAMSISVCMFGLGLVFKCYPKVDISLKSIADWLIPIAIFAAFAILFGERFGYFGMGQDEGVYQVKALAYLNGHFENVYTYPGVEHLSGNVFADAVGTLDKNVLGYYRLSDDSTNAVIHGVNTYPALLAWWGSMFGAANMGGINLGLMFASIVLVYQICRKLSAGVILSTGIAVTFSISPVLVWVNKSTLTESVLIMLMLYFAYMVICGIKRDEDTYNGLVFDDGEGRQNIVKLLSTLPIGAFCFFHISIYTILPMFFMIFIVLYIYDKSIMWLYNNLIMLGAYVVGFMFMLSWSKRYTTGNYKFIERIGISTGNITMLITIAVVVAVAINIAIMIFHIYRTSKNWELSEREREIKARRAKIIFAWVIRAFLVIALGLFFRAYKNGSFASYGVTDIYSTSFYAYASQTAFVAMIVALVVLLIYPNVILKSAQNMTIGIIFLYAVVFSSVVMNVGVGYYYYYARYSAVYAAFILLLFALIIAHIPKSAGKWIGIGSGIGIAIWSAFLFAKPLEYLREYQDDTRMSFAELEKVGDQFKEGDSIIVSNNELPTVFTYLSIVKGLDVYPVIYENLSSTYDIVKEYANGDIYFIGQSAADEEIEKNTVEGQTEANLLGVALYKDVLDVTEGTTDVQINKVTSVESNLSMLNKPKTIYGGSKLPYPIGCNEMKYYVDIYQLNK